MTDTDLEWALVLAEDALHDAGYDKARFIAMAVVGRLAEPLRQSQRVEGLILARSEDKGYEQSLIDELDTRAGRIEELETFIRRRMLDYSKDSAMASEAGALLDTEAKPRDRL